MIMNVTLILNPSRCITVRVRHLLDALNETFFVIFCFFVVNVSANVSNVFVYTEGVASTSQMVGHPVTQSLSA